MSVKTTPIILGSRSQRRWELLVLLIDSERIVVRPPLDPNEPDFHEVRDISRLNDGLSALARQKNDDVASQLRTDGSLAGTVAILTADTVIVGTEDDGRIAVLGQPPSEDWQQTVREWFQRYYIGRTHLAVTAVCLSTPDGKLAEQVVTTQVTFRDDAEDLVEWYLKTEEPIGKAGGYGLQGAGSLFVGRIDGSPSNVIGLPLRETAEMLQDLGII